MRKLTYAQMYAKAAKEINAKGGKYRGYYKGCSGGNALSLYVNDKFGVNAAADAIAHDALCEALKAVRQ